MIIETQILCDNWCKKQEEEKHGIPYKPEEHDLWLPCVIDFSVAIPVMVKPFNTDLDHFANGCAVFDTIKWGSVTVNMPYEDAVKLFKQWKNG